MKERFLAIASEVDRPGIEELLGFLNASDFFTAPCSTKHHLAVPGGLVQHSLNVREYLLPKVLEHGLHVSPATITVCGLFHDLCKVNFYSIDDEPVTEKQVPYVKSLLTQKQINFKTTFPGHTGQLTKGQAGVLISWLKDGDLSSPPELSLTYKINDLLPLGHGEKSVIMLQNFIKLTEEEQLAIRWHMGPFTDGFFSSYAVSQAYNAAAERYPLVTALFLADMEVANLVERENKEVF